MGAQTVLFSGDYGHGMDAEVEAENGLLTLVCRYHPHRDDTGVNAFDNPDDLADALEDRVRLHFAEAQLRVIRMMHEPMILTMAHLGRFGSPLLSIDKGRK